MPHPDASQAISDFPDFRARMRTPTAFRHGRRLMTDPIRLRAAFGSGGDVHLRQLLSLSPDFIISRGIIAREAAG